MVAGGAHPVQVLFSACAHNASRMRSETKSQGEGNKRETPLPGFLGMYGGSVCRNLPLRRGICSGQGERLIPR